MSNAHFEYLRESYLKVGSRTWGNTDFQFQDMDLSRRLFRERSLELRKPQPKDFEVYALLSGLPFQDEFTTHLVQKQREITAIIGDSLHYWVKPMNMGLEYFVFKWPDESIDHRQVEYIVTMLGSIKENPYLYEIAGIQVNPDGCVVAKGYDQHGTVFKIRKNIGNVMGGNLSRQSGWAHIPLGRILEQIDRNKFSRLHEFVRVNTNTPIASCQISSFKFIHELCWYMEKRTVIKEYALG